MSLNSHFFKNSDLHCKLLLLGLAVIIGFIYGLPHILLLNELDWDYQNAIFFTSFESRWDIEHYLAQIKEIYEGNYLLSNSYLAEYKNTERSLWPRFPYYCIAFCGKFLHINIQHIAVLMDFILPPLIFFITYSLLITFSRTKNSITSCIAILGAYLLVLTPHLSRIDLLLRMVMKLIQGIRIPSLLSEVHCSYCFTRTINPQLTYIFLLATLLFFIKGLITLKRIFFVLTIFLGIIVSYSYVYFSSYLYVVLFIMAIGFFCLKDKERLHQTLFILVTILFFSMPFWASLLNSPQNELTQMSEMRKNYTAFFLYPTHNMYVKEQMLLTLFVCCLILYSVRKGIIGNITGLFTFSLLLSESICLEQHIITGIRVQPWHYDVFVNPQSTIIVFFILSITMIPAFFSRKISLDKKFIYGGLGLCGFSLFFNPFFVSNYLSDDGVLSSAFRAFLLSIHIVGLLLGIVFISCYYFFSSSKFLSVKKYFRAASGKLSHLHLQNFLYILLLFYVMWDVGFGQYIYYHEVLKPKFGYLQKLWPALKWLNENTLKESVVLGSPDNASTSSIIPIYTHNNVYVSWHSQFYPRPSLSEIYDRLYNLMYIMGINTEDDFSKYLFDGLHFRDGMFDEYQKKITRDVYSELTKYQIDYIFYGPREKHNFKINPEQAYSFLQKVYDDNVVKIYRIL